MNFFEELKVLELASVLAGPATGMFFAELGATVIKVENARTNGDVTRNWKHQSEQTDSRVSAYFSSINYQKDYRQLDLSTAQDLSEVKKLIAWADVLITNFKEGAAEKFKLAPKTIQTINPSIIQCQLFGFSSDRSRPAFDAVLQAETGFMFMNGEANQPPVKMPVALIDILAAHQMKEAILIGLLQREKTGLGSYAEVSLERAAISSLANQATNWLMNEVIPERMGSKHPNIAPYGETFRCKDGRYIVLAVGSNKQFTMLCKVLDRSYILEDERFDSNENRVKNREALFDYLASSFLDFPSIKTHKALLKNGVPCGLVKDLKAVFETETAQEMIRRELIDGITTQRVTTLAFEFPAL